MSDSPTRRLGAFVRRRWKIVTPVAVVGLALVAWLAFGYFAVQTLFVDDVVDEAGPVFRSGAAADADPSEASTTPPTSAASGTTVPTEQRPSTPSTAASTTPTTTPPEPEVVTLARGDFGDRAHPTRGVATVLTDGSEQRFLRFEDFETDNGPDLDVYLSSAPADAPDSAFDDDFVGLGALKGNVGSQNYEIPPDVDLERYSTVVIWCVRFTVPFGTAPLA